jgi:hypothetical protein
MVVYSLRDDTATIRRIQDATLGTRYMGLQQTHGLLGSEEWWAHIAAGTLPLNTCRGRISVPRIAILPNRVAFAMRSDDGHDWTWPRTANSVALEGLYVPGAAIEVDYVRQWLKKTPGLDAFEADQVVEIRIAP